MSQNPSYSKHQRSKYKRWVATLPSGEMFQADTQEELHELIGRKDKVQRAKEVKPVE